MLARARDVEVGQRQAAGLAAIAVAADAVLFDGLRGGIRRRGGRRRRPAVARIEQSG